MNEPIDKLTEAEELRLRAERKLAAKSETAADTLAGSKRLVHELQVYQVELEMQNEALQEARAVAETALERYTELFDFAPIAYFILGRAGVILQMNFRGECLLNSERQNTIGTNLSDSVCCGHRMVFKAFLEKVFSGDNSQRCEISLQIGEDIRWADIEANADSTRQTCLMSVSDITDKKLSEQQLRLAAAFYLELDEGIMVTDARNQIVRVNPAFTTLTGYTEQESIGQALELFKSADPDQSAYQAMWESINTTGRWRGELWQRRKNGDLYLERLLISTLYGDKGEVIRRIWMFSDITEKNRVEEIIRKQANYDELTELPNRRLFLDRLEQAIHKFRRTHRKLALMFLDLDHFKDINDTLGHDMGDKLLKDVAHRLKFGLRDADTLARPGGDEFTLILAELNDLSAVDRVAQYIQNAMMEPFQLGNERCHVSFSIGITICPDDSTELDDLLKKADQAMYAAKQQGRGRFCYFTPAMQEAAQNRLRLTNDLRSALANQQFWVAYQPIVDLATDSIHKAEALLRWQHPERGLISPAEFIPIAEDTGMIIEIGHWVFHQVVRQVAEWRKIFQANFQVSINKSAKQFHNNGESHSKWFEYLRHSGLPGDSIVVEITEGLLLDESLIVAEKLVSFSNCGIQLSLDDFGTGYSSMSYLKRFNLDYLKIDQSFVRNLTTDSTDRTLCEVMILIAHKLGMKVIAEGVETDEQKDFLIQAGCDYAQGYLFSKPVPAEEFERLFQR
ncbi:MAG: EAL domain-containing protein [Gammaproteobacteria bacterium]